MKQAGGKPRHFMAQKGNTMRPGYFKVDAGEHGAMLILPGPFMKGVPVIHMRHWLDAYGIVGKLIYRAPPLVIEITSSEAVG